MITVQELIDALERFPRNMPVLADGYESGYEEALLPEIIRVKREPENMYYEGEYQSAEASDEAAIEVVAVFRNRRYD
jgi:hypothetical protein